MTRCRSNCLTRRCDISSASFLLQLTALICAFCPVVMSQAGGSNTLYGDLKVDESKVSGLKPMSFEVVLTGRNRSAIGRQMVAKNGRYRFENLANGTYYISVLMGNSEIANVRVILLSGTGTDNRIGGDYRQDIALEWRPNLATHGAKGSVVSALKYYERNAAQSSLFDKAETSMAEKDYARAISLLRQIVKTDPKDFEAWTELGTAHFLTHNSSEAENAYLRAIEQEPRFTLALLDLGKLRLEQKNFESAIEILTKAAQIPPPSAEANYFLGEAYLNLGKGSKAVAYMNEALKIDPLGKAEIHLRLAEIYDNVGLKDLAALEYEKFLEKRKDYADRKKLQKYIAQNKKKLT